MRGAEIEELGHIVCRRVASGERCETEPGLDELQNRGEVARSVRNEVRLRVRRDYPEGQAEAGLIELPRGIGRPQHWRDAVRLRLRDRNNVIECSATFVKGQDKRRGAPRRALHERVKDSLHIGGTLLHVLGGVLIESKLAGALDEDNA